MKNLITILLLFCAFSVKAQLVEITDKGVFFEVKSGSTFLNNYQKGEWQTDFNNDKIWLKNVNTGEAIINKIHFEDYEVEGVSYSTRDSTLNAIAAIIFKEDSISFVDPFLTDANVHNLNGSGVDPTITIGYQSDNTDSLGIRISTEGIDIGDIYNDDYYKLPSSASGFVENRVLKSVASGSGGYSDWLPICIEYTPTSESDSTYEVGTVAHDANYFYIKVYSSPHVWNRFAKTAW
jgi:hypothetical protein